MNSRQIKKNLVITGILAGLAIAFLSLFSDLQELRGVLANFDLRYLPIILILAPINYALRFVKWSYYLRIIGISLPLRESLVVFFSGFSMTITPGKVGELLKPYMLKQKYGVPISTTAPIVFAERLTDGVSMIILSCIGLLALNHGKLALLGISIPIAAFILVVQHRSLCHYLLHVLAKVPLLGKLSLSFTRLYESTYTLIRPKSLLYAVSLGIISWGIEGFVIFFTIRALGLQLSPLLALFVVSFSSIVGAVTMLPGGLFATEGSIIGLLVLMGIPSSAAVSITVVTRFSTLWLGVLVGVVAVLIAGKMGFLSHGGMAAHSPVAAHGAIQVSDDDPGRVL